MTNKTITLSRDHVERLIDRLSKAQMFKEVTELRATLAEPVPPAGGDVGANRDFSVYRDQCSITPDDEVTLKRHQANAYLASMRHLGLAERAYLPDAIRALQAESTELRLQYTACVQGRQSFRNALREKRAALKSVTAEVKSLQAELTTARELFRTANDIVEIAKKIDKQAFTKGTQNVDIGEFRALGYALERYTYQSSPADKAPPLIQALHANGDRIAMEATIAQQAQRIADLEADKGQGEPVAWLVRFPADDDCFATTKQRVADIYRKAGDGIVVEPLYATTAPANIEPAPAAVVMPPEQCRQRIAAEGKPYPRSSCAICGQFSPKWRECDAMIEASSGKQK